MLTLEDTKSVELPPEQVAIVRSHLQEVLTSDAFMGGHRAQRFLQLVVEHVLAGRSDSLRERMLGAEMFGRPIDYDTGNDAVVRVKASDVRRRLAQYYQSLTTPPSVQIDLPTGSYAPQFRWAPVDVPSTPAAFSEDVAIAPRWKYKPWALRILLLTIYSAVLISLGWFTAVRFGTPHRTPTAADPIWAALFDG